MLSQGIKRSRHPNGLELTYDPRRNLFKYYNKPITSVSHLCGKFFPSFSSLEGGKRKKVAERVAEKENKTLDQVLSEWKSAQVLAQNVRAHVHALVNQRARAPVVMVHGDEEMYYKAATEAVEKWFLPGSGDDVLEVIETDALVCIPPSTSTSSSSTTQASSISTNNKLVGVGGKIDFLCRKTLRESNDVVMVAVDLKVSTGLLPSSTKKSKNSNLVDDDDDRFKTFCELAPLQHIRTDNNYLARSTLGLLMSSHIFRRENFVTTIKSGGRNNDVDAVKKWEHGILHIARDDKANFSVGSDFHSIDAEKFLLPSSSSLFGNDNSNSSTNDVLEEAIETARKLVGRKR